MTLTNIRVFKSDNIDELNVALWNAIYSKGSHLYFGSVEEPKDAREIYAVVQLYGKALQDLYEGRLPKGWKFGEAAQKIYIEMLKDPEKGDQPYTYGQRLKKIPVWDGTKYPVNDEWIADCIEVNQLNTAKDALENSITEGIQTNRICGVLWIPTDIMLENPPCFQHFQLRLSEKNKVSLRIYFRSNDAGNAVFANMGAVIRVFTDEVIKPAGGELEEVIWTSTSMHVYENDMDMVEALIGKIPEHIRRMM